MPVFFGIQFRILLNSVLIVRPNDRNAKHSAHSRCIKIMIIFSIRFKNVHFVQENASFIKVQWFQAFWLCLFFIYFYLGSVTRKRFKSF